MGELIEYEKYVSRARLKTRISRISRISRIFFSPTFINPCFQYSPKLDFKKSKIFKHPCFRYSL